MFAKSMATFLEKSNFGTIDKDIFINRFPSRRGEADNSICVYDTASYAIRGRERNSVDFTCQIRVRNQQNDVAVKIAHDIYLLLNKGEISDGNDKRFCIRPLNPPTFLMYDDSNRANWILNVTGLALNYERIDY